MTWTVKPDVYLAGFNEVNKYVRDGTLAAPSLAYVTNTLTIIVAAGNRMHMRTLADLARPRMKLALQNPALEGIAHQIKVSLEKAGGSALVTQVYETKVQDGSTILAQRRLFCAVSSRQHSLVCGFVNLPFESAR